MSELVRQGLVAWLMLTIALSHAGESLKQDPSTLVFPTFLHTYGIRKATQFHLFLFTNNRVKFENPQGLAVVRLRAWEDTTTTRDDDEVTVYGVNSGQNNIIYNKSMKSIGVYGLDEQGNHRLNAPHGIAANEFGDVYVCDSGNHRVVKLRNEDNELVFRKAAGARGEAAGMFRAPRGVTLDSENNVYVTDRDNHRVQVFSPDLDYLYEWGGLSGPDAIAVTDRGQRWSYFKEEFVVVIDSANQRLQKFDLKGNVLGLISASQMGVKQPYFAFLALDYYNNIYITDAKNHCIHKLNHRLLYLTSYGQRGDGDREFIEPRGITMYRRFGQIFVAEKYGAQYYWVGADCYRFETTPLPDARTVKFRYFLTEHAFVTADILDEDNNLITRLWTKRMKATGMQQDIWDGRIFAVPDSVFGKEKLTPTLRFKDLKNIPNGRYKVRYKIEPTYSSYHHFEKIFSDEFLIEFSQDGAME
ncbi:MAG: NHL repeat-containing protein [Candidatus Zhuqueibacterota bacterium]